MQRYTGSIALVGMRPFEFSTSAPSEAKAKSNGMAQFARHLNMSIQALNRYMRDNRHEITIGIADG